MSQVTQAQYNAGNILLNVKSIELGKIQKNLQRLRGFNDRLERKSGSTMPYTEEDIITLMTHKLAAIISGNYVMTLFWMKCTNKVIEDVLWATKMEKLYQHQARRVDRIAERYGNRAGEISLEVQAIRRRMGTPGY
jgi:predicted metal-dependent hydrolase